MKADGWGTSSTTGLEPRSGSTSRTLGGSLRVIAAGAAADRRAFAEHPHGAVRVGQKADAEVTVQSGARGHVITKSCEVLFSQPFSIRKRRI